LQFFSPSCKKFHVQFLYALFHFFLVLCNVLLFRPPGIVHSWYSTYCKLFCFINPVPLLLRMGEIKLLVVFFYMYSFGGISLQHAFIPWNHSYMHLCLFVFQISLQMKFYIRQYLRGDVATVWIKVAISCSMNSYIFNTIYTNRCVKVSLIIIPMLRIIFSMTHACRTCIDVQTS
jgi:hypothetical protein